MRSLILKVARIIVLILILPLLAIFLSPSSQVSADCPVPGDQPIRVDNGLISAYDPSSFYSGANVFCVTDQRATIPQFAIQTYDEMKTLYFDQAKSSFSKTTLSGNQIQSTTTLSINLSSF